MNIESDFSDADLTELEEFLSSETLPEHCMQFSMLDGFLAAIKVLPFEIPMEKYLPWIWDMENGVAKAPIESPEQFSRITDLIKRYGDSIRAQISARDYAPMLDMAPCSDDSEYYDAAGWCEGFMLATQFATDLWDPVFAQEIEAIAPLLLLGTESGEQILGESENPREAAFAACEELPDMVDWLDAYFQASNPTVSIQLA